MGTLEEERALPRSSRQGGGHRTRAQPAHGPARLLALQARPSPAVHERRDQKFHLSSQREAQLIPAIECGQGFPSPDFPDKLQEFVKEQIAKWSKK